MVRHRQIGAAHELRDHPPGRAPLAHRFDERRSVLEIDAPVERVPTREFVALHRALGRQDVRAVRAQLIVRDLGTDQQIKLGQRFLQRLHIGEGAEQVAAEIEQGVHVALLDFLRQDGAGPVVEDTLHIGAHVRAGREGAIQQRQVIDELVEGKQSAGVDPQAALHVHRPCQNRDQPGEPDGEVAAGGHAGAGAGFDRQDLAAANGVQQFLQLLFGHTGDLGGLGPVIVCEKRAQPVQVLDRLLRIQGTARQNLAHDPGQYGIVATGVGSDMALREVGGFGAHRVDHPDFAAALVDRLEPVPRLEHAGIVRMAYHRIGADIEHHLAVVVVGLGIDAVEAGHGPGDHHLGGGVVGQRGELGRCAERFVEGLFHRVAGGIQAQPAAEVHAHRIWAVLVDHRAQALADIVERFIPRHFDQFAVLAHHRLGDGMVEVMDLPGGPPLRAAVALRDRVIRVGLDLENLLIVGDFGDEAAVRHADLAISALVLDPIAVLGLHRKRPGLFTAVIDLLRCHDRASPSGGAPDLSRPVSVHLYQLS